MGTFSEFLDSKGLKDEDILQRSRRMETLRSKDRELRRLRALKRRKAPQQSYEEAGIEKPRSGRPLQREHLAAARNDIPVPGPVRSKILRAVNDLLAKRGESVTAPELFGNVPGKQGKKPR